jgi:Flp pilus assembly pilin Flp
LGEVGVIVVVVVVVVISCVRGQVPSGIEDEFEAFTGFGGFDFDYVG